MISLVKDFSELHKQFQAPQPCTQTSEKLGRWQECLRSFQSPDTLALCAWRHWWLVSQVGLANVGPTSRPTTQPVQTAESCILCNDSSSQASRAGDCLGSVGNSAWNKGRKRKYMTSGSNVHRILLNRDNTKLQFISAGRKWEKPKPNLSWQGPLWWQTTKMAFSSNIYSKKRSKKNLSLILRVDGHLINKEEEKA